MLSKIIVAIYLLFSAIAVAQSYIHAPGKRIEIVISDKGLNRIALEKDRILKIIGNDGDYAVDADLSKGFIYLNPRGAKDKSFPATIISEKGMVQDIKFKVANIDSRTVIIKKRRQKKPVTYVSFEDRVTNALSNVLQYKTALYQMRVLKKLTYTSLPLKLEKVTEYIIPKESFKIIRLEYISKESMSKMQLMSAFGNLIAATERGNNIVIAVKI